MDIELDALTGLYKTNIEKDITYKYGQKYTSRYFSFARDITAAAGQTISSMVQPSMDVAGVFTGIVREVIYRPQTELEEYTELDYFKDDKILFDLMYSNDPTLIGSVYYESTAIFNESGEDYGYIRNTWTKNGNYTLQDPDRDGVYEYLPVSTNLTHSYNVNFAGTITGLNNHFTSDRSGEPEYSLAQLDAWLKSGDTSKISFDGKDLATGEYVKYTKIDVAQISGDQVSITSGVLPNIKMKYYADPDVNDGIKYGERTIDGARREVLLNAWAFFGSDYNKYNVSIVNRTDTQIYRDNTSDHKYGDISEYTEYSISSTGEESLVTRKEIKYYTQNNFARGEIAGKEKSYLEVSKSGEDNFRDESYTWKGISGQIHQFSESDGNYKDWTDDENSEQGYIRYWTFDGETIVWVIGLEGIGTKPIKLKHKKGDVVSYREKTRSADDKGTEYSSFMNLYDAQGRLVYHEKTLIKQNGRTMEYNFFEHSKIFNEYNEHGYLMRTHDFCAIGFYSITGNYKMGDPNNLYHGNKGWVKSIEVGGWKSLTIEYSPVGKNLGNIGAAIEAFFKNLGAAFEKALYSILGFLLSGGPLSLFGLDMGSIIPDVGSVLPDWMTDWLPDWFPTPDNIQVWTEEMAHDMYRKVRVIARFQQAFEEQIEVGKEAVVDLLVGNSPVVIGVWIGVSIAIVAVIVIVIATGIVSGGTTILILSIIAAGAAISAVLASVYLIKYAMADTEAEKERNLNLAKKHAAFILNITLEFVLFFSGLITMFGNAFESPYAFWQSLRGLGTMWLGFIESAIGLPEGWIYDNICKVVGAFGSNNLAEKIFGSVGMLTLVVGISILAVVLLGSLASIIIIPLFFAPFLFAIIDVNFIMTDDEKDSLDQRVDEKKHELFTEQHLKIARTVGALVAIFAMSAIAKFMKALFARYKISKPFHASFKQMENGLKKLESRAKLENKNEIREIRKSITKDKTKMRKHEGAQSRISSQVLFGFLTVLYWAVKSFNFILMFQFKIWHLFNRITSGFIIGTGMTIRRGIGTDIIFWAGKRVNRGGV
ncbi:hypothetical protein KKC59_01560, partial [bacterium]|nr:hypothetical protein [bacterium]